MAHASLEHADNERWPMALTLGDLYPSQEQFLLKGGVQCKTTASTRVLGFCSHNSDLPDEVSRYAGTSWTSASETAKATTVSAIRVFGLEQ